MSVHRPKQSIDGVLACFRFVPFAAGQVACDYAGAKVGIRLRIESAANNGHLDGD
jgi:hypothetical protein